MRITCSQALLLAISIHVPLSAELMPAAQQTALVQKYCAVCHTDAAKNGGLSLQHYDAAVANPPLAAMLLSKLQNGAIGAAGLGMPDKPAREAWTAATMAQAQGANNWTVLRTETESPVLTASIVREVTPRGKPQSGAPLYRLTVACNTATREGELQVSWSPDAQTSRTFFVSADGSAAIPHRLENSAEKMGNGTAGIAGLAAANMNGPLPDQTLTIRDLFPGETVVFPVGDLDRNIRRQLAACVF